MTPRPAPRPPVRPRPADVPPPAAAKPAPPRHPPGMEVVRVTEGWGWK